MNSNLVGCCPIPSLPGEVPKATDWFQGHLWQLCLGRAEVQRLPWASPASHRLFLWFHGVGQKPENRLWAGGWVCIQTCDVYGSLSWPLPQHKPTCALPFRGGDLAEEELPLWFMRRQKPPISHLHSPDCCGPHFFTRRLHTPAKPSLPRCPRARVLSTRQQGSGGALLHVPRSSIPLPGPQGPRHKTLTGPACVQYNLHQPFPLHSDPYR